MTPDDRASTPGAFTEHHLGRMTLDGHVTEHAIPTDKAEPHGLTVGPDGALWFAEEVGKIGRLGLSA